MRAYPTPFARLDDDQPIRRKKAKSAPPAASAPPVADRPATLVEALRRGVGERLAGWRSDEADGPILRAHTGHVTVCSDLTPAQRAAQRADLDARRVRMGLPPRPPHTIRAD